MFAGPLILDKHLKIVRELLWSVRAQWYDVGLGLRIREDDLKVTITSIHSY